MTVDTGSGMRRRALLAATVLAGGVLAVCAAATQFVAWHKGYAPGLGSPWFRHVYAPWSWLRWRNEPWATQSPRTFSMVEAGLYAVGGLATVAIAKLALTGRQRPEKPEGVHGTAAFGAEDDAREAGLLAPHDAANAGVYVGALPDDDGALRYLMHDGPEHVLGLGPLRSGKTNGMCVNTLVSWPASAIVYDTKGELYEKTAGWRAREARNVVLRWEPAAKDNTVAWNPMAEVRLGTDYEFRDVANIMEMIADPQGEGLRGHWDPTSAAFLVGVGLHVAYEQRARGKTASLSDVVNALDDPSRNAVALYRSMVANQHLQGRRHEAVARIGQQMANRDIKESSGIHSTASRHLRLFHDPVVARNTRTSDFRIDDLVNQFRPASLYIVARGEDELRMRPLVRLFLTMMMGRLCSAPLRMQDGREVSPHKHRLLLALDEFATLREMKEFELALGKCAGFGIKAFLLVQDREQIIDAYGPNESITSHCHIRAGYAPNNLKTAEWMSEMLGQSTVVVEAVTESGDRGSRMKHVSRTYHTVSRPLMTPDEVMRLKAPTKDVRGEIVSPGNVLVFVAGRKPIVATQALYFRDPEFNRRVAIPAPATHRIVRRTMTPAPLSLQRTEPNPRTPVPEEAS